MTSHNMKPVAIFRFSPIEGPGYFSEFLDKHGIPWSMIRVDEGDSLPIDASAYSGVCLMGGPMSVNDPLPWIPKVLSMVRDAFVKDIPLIGHCLGGQLISKGLGGRVKRNSVKEIGWSQLLPAKTSEAAKWFGPYANEPFTVFQWHGETFEIPMQANLVATNDYCTNQIFTLGPHLAMQCHVEMTAEMIAAWCEHWESEDSFPSATVQTPMQISKQLERNIPYLRLIADSLYSCWISGLK